MIKKMLLTLVVGAMALTNVDAAQYRLKANPSIGVKSRLGFDNKLVYRRADNRTKVSAEEVEAAEPIAVAHGVSTVGIGVTEKMPLVAGVVSEGINLKASLARKAWNATCSGASAVRGTVCTLRNFGITNSLLAAGTVIASMKVGRTLLGVGDYTGAAYALGTIVLPMTAYLGYQLVKAARAPEKPADAVLTDKNKAAKKK